MTIEKSDSRNGHEPVEELIAENRRVIASTRKKRKRQRATAEKAEKTLSKVSRTLRHASG